MEACGDCKTLKQEFWRAREHYVSLIVQHDQMIRVGKPEASRFDNRTKRARRKRTAAARLLLAHRGNHEDLSRPKITTATQP